MSAPGTVPAPAAPVDHSRMRLGRRARRPGTRVPRLDGLAMPVQLPPPVQDWHSRVASWPMMLNDQLGDCTCAAVGHAIQQWSTYAGAPLVMSDAQVQALYAAAAGYRPGDPATDRGAVEADVLACWTRPGVDMGRAVPDVLTGFAEVAPADHAQVRQAVAWFANLYIGLALPLSAQRQGVWDVPRGGARGQGAPGSWGGHAVLVVGYDPQGLVCVTWGALKRMTWAFWDAYVDEAYALLSRDFVTTTGTVPDGLSWAQLQADMAGLQRG